ncbi:hypothetical protein RB195_026309 [Necator americanus]|uniref:Uncharacterized protein n=1 Tax=Necator americanus TaxID=51031 RepID=A0ABR1EWG9_NECAM
MYVVIICRHRKDKRLGYHKGVFEVSIAHVFSVAPPTNNATRALRTNKDDHSSDPCLNNYTVKKEDGKVVLEFFSDLPDSHVYLAPHYFTDDGHVILNILHSKVRHAIAWSNIALHPVLRVKSECLKDLSPVLINTR